MCPKSASLSGGWVGQITVQRRLSAPGIKIECRQEWVDELDAFQQLTVLEIFTEDHGGLVQAGGGPDLGVVIGQRVISRPARRVQYDQRGQIEHREYLDQALCLGNSLRIGVQGLLRAGADVDELSQHLGAQATGAGQFQAL